MNPQQNGQPPNNQPPKVEQTPYDFIMNSGQAPKQPAFGGGFGGSGSSMKQRLLFVSGIGLGVIFLLIIMASLFSGGGGGRDSLLRVQQIQAETVRVSDLSLQDVSDQAVKNAVVNAKLASASDQQSLSSVAAQLGVSFSEDELALGQNAETDTQLEDAKAAGLLDETTVELLRSQLQAYESALAAAFEATSSQALQEELTREYNGLGLLLTQLDNTGVSS